MSLYPFISTESMEWDTFAVNDEPVSIADFIVEEIVSIDESINSEESTSSSDERSERSVAENDVDTDESPNLNEDSDDAAENVIIDNPFEDEEFQNFQAVEIRDINAMLDAISELSDAEDKEFLEMHAMVLGDYTEEEHEESDSEMQALVLGDYTEEELEESDCDTLISDSGYGIYQAADIDVSDGIPKVINGLGPQKSSQQKILEWLEKMV